MKIDYLEQHSFQKEEVITQLTKNMLKGDLPVDISKLNGFDWGDKDKFYNLIGNVIYRREITIQECIARLGLDVDNHLDIKDMHTILEGICSTSYIALRIFGQRMILQSQIEMPQYQAVDNLLYPLPQSEPIEVVDNSDMGLNQYGKHVILGGKLKEHNGELVLSHLNRLNAIPLTINGELFKLVEPVFKGERKITKEGSYETDQELADRKKTFEEILKTVHINMRRLLKRGNEFHMPHGYCTRGRTYVISYEFNYQGLSFQKAQIEFANKEVVADDF